MTLSCQASKFIVLAGHKFHVWVLLNVVSVSGMGEEIMGQRAHRNGFLETHLFMSEVMAEDYKITGQRMPCYGG